MAGFREPLHIDAVNGLDPEAPVVMLNLMKFREASSDGNGTGWDAYLRYSRQVVPLLRARGATIIWAGTIQATAFGSEVDGDWDYVALVWYPKPSAFVDMLSSAEYAAANTDRENGTERHLIMATRLDYSKPAPMT